MAIAMLELLLCVAFLVTASSPQVLPTNVAVNKPATQSSTFDLTDPYVTPNLTYRAEARLAVDGRDTKAYPAGTCAVTEWTKVGSCTDNPWWQVDLGDLYDVFNVTIYQRGEGEAPGKENRGPLVVWIGDHVERPENRTKYTDRPVVSIPLSPPVTASTVNISITGCSILILCEVEVYAVRNEDECKSIPCLHGGTCHSDGNSYTCTCVPGYTGVNCSTDIDECVLGYCQNGAICINTAGSYSCACAVGYTGRNCSTDMDECASSPCPPNSLCVEGMNSYSCHCASGFTGPRCNQPCSGGTFGPGCRGTCSPYCLESSVRGGQHCDHVTGQCLLQTGCKDGFQGPTCSIKEQTGAVCPADRLAEGVGIGLAVGLGTSLLVALVIFILLRFRRQRKPSSDGTSMSDVQTSSRQMEAAARQRHVSQSQESRDYEILDDASKDRNLPSPYSELGEIKETQSVHEPYSN